MPDKNYLQNAVFVFLTIAVWMVCTTPAQAQMLDLSQFKKEHLITQNTGGDTGDVSIYVSFPNWFGNAGYCPVRVRVVPRKGLLFKFSGQLQVVISSLYFGGGSDRRVVIDVPIENGNSEANGEVLGNFLLDKRGRFGNQFMISAKLNGRKLSGQQVVVYSGNTANINNGFKSLSLISKESSQYDSNRLEALAEMAETGNWFSHVRCTESLLWGAYGDVATMPPNWLYLSGVPSISVGFDDLSSMDLKGLECVNNYVLSGGYLVVNKVPSIQAVVGLLPIDISRQYTQAKSSARKLKNTVATQANHVVLSDFESPSLDLFEKTIWDEFQLETGGFVLSGRNNQLATMGAVPRRQFNSGQTGFPYPQTLMDPYEAMHWISGHALDIGRAYIDAQLASPCAFASQFYDASGASMPSTAMSPVFVDHGFGSVYLNNSRRSDRSNLLEEVFRSNTPQQITLISNSSNRTSRFADGVGDDFWNWLIPSVGRTPVIPFLAFVILFVGAAAPGIMYWSNRHKRRVWLVLLMPLTAALCTLLLFTYGLLKDGLGAVSRTRSLAFVDERGNGMVWSRQSYFAATVSNDGLTIGQETQFAPMTVNSFADLPACEQFCVDGTQQYRGILPPRLQSQFSVTHPLRKLSVMKRSTEADSILNGPAILNISNFTWNKAVFVGLNGDFFIASDVGPGQKATCELSSREEVIIALKKEYKSQALNPPIDSPSADQTSLAQTFSGMFSFRTGRNNSIGQITEETTWTNHLGMSADNQTVLLPGTYVIFASDAPYVERCLPGVKDQEGLHTIVGRW